MLALFNMAGIGKNEIHDRMNAKLVLRSSVDSTLVYYKLQNPIANFTCTSFYFFTFQKGNI
jgi:hypothetical protein